MENKNKENEKIIKAAKITIASLLVLIFIGFEFLVLELIKFICFGSFWVSLLLLLLLNFLIIRYLVKCYIFIGSNTLTIKFMLKEINK